MLTSEFIKAIKKERDPKKVVELWSLAFEEAEHENSEMTLKDLMYIHKECNKEITQAALLIETIDFE
jgi:hypothetical protein|tara:strand:+ start:1485 stop:1685 length:201 start_codon:yes stop_codon:yes gene_type:complete